MRNILIAIVAFTAFMASCNKPDELQPSRLFRPPATAGQLSADSNTVVATWQKIAGAKSYQLQLSRDTFKTVDRNLTMDTSVAVIKGLLFNQNYQIQVKAIAPDTTLNSGWSFLGNVKTLSSILKVPSATEITFKAVRVTWTTKGAPVTSIKIIKTSDSSVVSTTNLTTSDLANGYKIISGLASSTKYTIFLYSGTDVRGTVDFTTKPPYSGTVIDLTDITGRPSVLADTIPVIPSGSLVLLKRGEAYTISSSISLSKSIVIRSGDDLSVTTPADILFTSNFNFAAGATIDSIEFNDVYMRSDQYSSRYIFNTTNSATVGKMKFLNSKIEIFRGIVRLQSGTTTVNNFIIDNCILDSLSNYGVITVDNTTVKADNISITNSTIYKAERFITSSKQTAGSASVVVSNCTFNETLTGSNILIDYGSFNVTNGITVSNCIFGAVKGGGTASRDVRAGAATTINASNNFRTSDYISAGAANDLPGVTPYSRPSTQLWQDPVNGNFRIVDASFPGRTNTGDPRWRP